jgi:hypothetical protein
MQIARDESKTVNQLRDDIVAELQHESTIVQIRVAFAVLVAVIINGTHTDADGVRDALLELQSIMRIAS